MIQGLLHAISTLMPGEAVEDPGGGRPPVVVYPLGVRHLFASGLPIVPLINAVLSASSQGGPADVVELAVELRPLLIGDGLPVLIACSQGLNADASQPLLELAADAWVRQTWTGWQFPKPPDGEGGSTYHISEELLVGDCLMQLQAAGHRFEDIIGRQQMGFDGRPLPYTGWSIGMLSYWSTAAKRAAEVETANVADAVAAAVGLALGGSTAKDEFEKFVMSRRQAGMPVEIEQPMSDNERFFGIEPTTN